MKVLLATVYSPSGRSTLAAARSLGKSGVQVHIGSDRFFGQPFYSRYCRKRRAYVHPAEDMGRFLKALQMVVASEHYDVLLPMSEYTIPPILKHRSCFDPFVKIPMPDYKAVKVFRDKLITLETARSLEIEVPKTYAPGNIHELRAVSKKIGYPCVFKLRKGAGAVGLKFPESAASLMRCYESLPAARSHVFDYRSPLVQEYVPGLIHDVCLLFNRGEPRAVLSQKRLMMYPPAGGVGIYNVTTDEPELKQKAVKLLSALNWHGPAQVEFKKDSRTGRAVLMEVNGRFWGTLDLAIQAGIPFPLLACQMAVSGDVEPVYRYEVGLKYRWSFPLGLLYLRRSQEKRRALYDLFGTGRSVRSESRWSDPLPLLIKFLAMLGTTFQNRFLKSYSKDDRIPI